MEKFNTKLKYLVRKYKMRLYSPVSYQRNQDEFFPHSMEFPSTEFTRMEFPKGEDRDEEV